ncbi:hypothetical protein EVAR_29412_1 [Eumeta japonica]|uniref:Uncharacterized protein n=1 Tax=Eumeta variegata TaxID=151549 RepID=A0A4C1VW29_EUMVA|nr:hypothetical protein EVAR_29412_1 [Eumeta japonica]
MEKTRQIPFAAGGPVYCLRREGLHMLFDGNWTFAEEELHKSEFANCARRPPAQIEAFIVYSARSLARRPTATVETAAWGSGS